MTDLVGIRLDDSVLPLSNTPAWLPPYAMAPSQILTKAGRHHF
jgi:hypothetical protein